MKILSNRPRCPRVSCTDQASTFAGQVSKAISSEGSTPIRADQNADRHIDGSLDAYRAPGESDTSE